MAGYIGSKASVTQVDGYNTTEADAEFLNQTEGDARYVELAGDTLTGALTGTDLTLSGGVYLGGTGSANKLDEVEEGTFVPSLDLTGYGTIAGDPNYGGHYMKIKDSVWFNIYCRWDTSARTGVSDTFITLPFTAAQTSQNYSAIYVSYLSNFLQNTGTTQVGGYVVDNASKLRLHIFRDTTETPITDTYLVATASAGIMVSGYYRAA